MKGIKSTVIPLEPDSQEALEEVLKSGAAAKVKLAGSDTVFMMQRCEKGDDYELSQVSVESPSDEMRKALEKIKQQLQ